MQRNCTQRCETSFVERDGISRRFAGWYSRDQETRDTCNFRMQREAGSRTRNTVSCLKVGHAIAHSNHSAGAAVTGVLWLIQAAAYRLNGRKQAVPLHFVEDLAHQVRARLGFLQ